MNFAETYQHEVKRRLKSIYFSSKPERLALL